MTGRVHLKDGGSVEITMNRKKETLRGIAVWHHGDLLCLPYEVSFEVAPMDSEPYPQAQQK